MPCCRHFRLDRDVRGHSHQRVRKAEFPLSANLNRGKRIEKKALIQNIGAADPIFRLCFRRICLDADKLLFFIQERAVWDRFLCLGKEDCGRMLGEALQIRFGIQVVAVYNEKCSRELVF